MIASSSPPCRGPNAPAVDPLFSARDRLESLLAKIPDRYRVPVVLHHVHGMGEAEIAGALGVPVEAIRRRLQEGVARLERHMRSVGWENARWLLWESARGGELLAPPPSLGATELFSRGVRALSKGPGITVADLVGENGPRAVWGEWRRRLREGLNRVVGLVGASLM